MTAWTLGIIGGSGLYETDGLESIRTETPESPWGTPSGAFTTGQLNGINVCFLQRHGSGHCIPPDAINYRANIDAFKRLGCTDILSLSACGSLREDLKPGDFVLVDQYVDHTSDRARSFFGEGCVAHVGFADPVCPRLAELAADAGEAAGARTHRGGTYLAMQGPQFSTRAESELYRQWGCDVIGMTNMPEARLAREAELPYASVCMVTDYDCWNRGETAVDVQSILKVMAANTLTARRLISALTRVLASTPRTPSPSGAETALDGAILTAPSARNPARLARLDAVAGRLLGT